MQGWMSQGVVVLMRPLCHHGLGFGLMSKRPPYSVLHVEAYR